MEKEPARRGLSKEAWVAVGAIGAAVVTAAATVLTQLMGSSDHSPESASGPSRATSSAPITSAAPAVDSIIGSWKGTARDSNDVTFRITLDIIPGCALGKLCGSISVSHVPCYGQVSLENVENEEFEFRVTKFDKRSDLSTCRPGAGELFHLHPDGRLTYRTSYEPKAEGTLRKG